MRNIKELLVRLETALIVKVQNLRQKVQNNKWSESEKRSTTFSAVALGVVENKMRRTVQPKTTRKASNNENKFNDADFFVRN